MDHDWPGNVRELENAMERAIVTCRDSALKDADFGFLRGSGPRTWQPATNATLAEIEKQTIAAVLKRFSGNITETAAVLGIERSTLYDKIKKYGIARYTVSRVGVPWYFLLAEITMMVMRRAGLVRFILSLLIVVFAACSGCASRAPGPGTAQARWWQNAVIYEIYPRSFADTNGDGVGDLNGITKHLDYLADLGVDAIWITPFYPSPQVDFGYDISDYRAIDPQYGTMADFDRLVAEASKRNIRIRDRPGV